MYQGVYISNGLAHQNKYQVMVKLADVIRLRVYSQVFPALVTIYAGGHQ